jgi:hypothetical protein
MAYTLTPAERRARAQSLRENRENRKLYYDYLKKKAALEREQQIQRNIELQAEQEKANQSFLVRGLSTVGDIVANVLTGAVKGLEGIVDLGIGLVGGIGGIFDGNFQERAKNAIAYDWTGETFGNALQEALKYSYTTNGGTIENVASGIGQMLPSVVVSIATAGAGAPAAVAQATSLATLGVSAAGTSTEEAFQEGADYWAGLGYGTASGLVEVGTEKMFGGATKALTGAGILDGVTRSVADTGIKRIAKNALEEGFEEVVSELANPALKSIYKGSEAFNDYGNLDYWKGVGEAGLVGSLTALAYSGTVGYGLSKVGVGYVGKEADIADSLSEIATLKEKANNLQANGELIGVNEQKIADTTKKNYQNIEKVLQGVSEDKRLKLIEKFNLDKAFNTDGSMSGQLSSWFNSVGESAEVSDGSQNELASLKKDSYSFNLRGQEQTIASDLDTISENLANKYMAAEQEKGNNITIEQAREQVGKVKVFDGEMSDNAKQSRNKFNKALNYLNKESGANLSFVVTESNDAFNGLVIDDRTMYIGEDQFEKGTWAETLVHEYTHLSEGSEEYAKLVDFLSSDNVLVDDGNGGKVELWKKGQESVFDKNYGFDREKIQEIHDKIANAQELTADEQKYFKDFMSEVGAHETQYLLGNEEFIDLIVARDSSFAKKFLQKIENLRKAFERVGDKEARKAYKQIHEAEKLYLKAAAKAGDMKLVKFILSRNPDLEKEIDVSAEIKYNKKAKYLNISKQEYAIISSRIMEDNSSVMAKGGEIARCNTARSANYFYVYENFSEGNFGVLKQIALTDDKIKYINAIEAKIGESNGESVIRSTSELNRVLEVLKNKSRNDSRNNAYDSGRRADSGNGELSIGQSESERIGNTGKGDGNKRVKYSLKIGNENLTVDGEERKNLVALHNLSEEKLMKVLELGGFPMPSIAITRADLGHEQFGDITVIFGRETIDPKVDSRNKVYSRDGYTPTVPKIDYKVNDKVLSKISKKYYELSKKFGYDTTRPLYKYVNDMERVLEDNAGEFATISQIYNDTDIMQLYLLDSGKEKIQPVYKEITESLPKERVEYLNSLINHLGKEAILEITPKDGESLFTHRHNYAEKYRDKIAEFLVDGKIYKNTSEVFEDFKDIDLLRLVISARNFINNGATTTKSEFDSSATNKAIREATPQKEYHAWVDSLFEGIQEKTGIRNDKDIFTPSGNRRSFEATHDSYTLDNIIKAMKRAPIKGDGGFVGLNVNALAAKLSREFKSVAEIRKNADSLKTFNQEIQNNFIDTAREMISEIERLFVPQADNSIQSWTMLDGASTLIGEIADNGFTTEKQIADYMAREYKNTSYRYSKEVGDKILALFDYVRQMTDTDYFESKPRRAVEFKEIRDVLIPENASEKLIKALDEQGIEHITYTEKNTRSDIINKLDNIRFSLKEDSDGRKLSEGQKEYFKNSKVIDEDGNLMVVYHGTPKPNFSVFKLGDGALGNGIYFAESKEYSKGFSFGSDPYEVYLNITNPYEVNYPISDSITEKLIAKGYDGIHHKQNGFWVAFSPEQIKLVDNLTPTKNEDIRFDLKEDDLSKKYRYELSDGQIKKLIADKTMRKVYSKVESEKIINTILSESLGVGEKYGSLTGRAKSEVIEMLWRGLNTAEPGRQMKVALDVAEYIIQNSVLENLYEDSENSIYIDTINALKPYLHSLDLSALKGEIKYKFDNDNSAYLLWGKRKGEKGLTADQIKMELDERGFFIDSDNEADIFFRMDSAYREAVAAMKKQTKELLSSALSAEERKTLKNNIAREVLIAFDKNGKQSTFSKILEQYHKEALTWKEKYYDERTRNSVINRLLDKVQKVKDWKSGTFLNASQYKADIFKRSIDKLANIKFRGDLNQSGTRDIVSGLKEWYSKSNPLLEGVYDSEIAEMLDDIATSEGKLSTQELRNLSNVVDYFKHFVETYNKVYRNGKYVEAQPIAEKYVSVIKRNQSVKVGWLKKYFEKYLATFGDPITVARYFDKYESGFYSEMLATLRESATKAQIDEMNIREPIEEFIKKNKKYFNEAEKMTVKYQGRDIPLLQAMYVYMAMNDVDTIPSFAKSGFVFNDGNSDVRIDGFAANEDVEIAEMQIMAKEIQTSLEKQFSAADKEYIEIARKIFNEDCRKRFSETSIILKGYTNAKEGDYVPIRRANIAKNVDTSTFEYEVNRASNASFTKDRVKGAKGELRVDGIDTVLDRHIRAVAQYANLAPAIEEYNKLFSLNTGEDNNKPVSVSTESRNLWAKGDEYFKKLISDIQGIPSTKGDGIKLMAFIRGGYAKFQLGANPKVWVTQLSSFFAAGSILDYSSIVKGIGIKAGDVDTYCELAKLRNNDNTVAMAQGVLDKIDKVGNVLMKPIGTVDRFVITKLFGACQVQVQKDYGLKIGTEENKVKAGELLKRVILETQQNSMATERSSAMRSGSEFMRTITMFSADSMKVIGRVVDSIGELSALKSKKKILTDANEIANIDKQIKQATKKVAKSTASLITSAVFMALVAQLFRTLYNKDDEEDNVVANMATDAIGNLFGGLPIFKDIYSRLVEGYDIDGYAYSAINDMLDSADNIFKMCGDIVSGEVTSQEVAKNIKNMVYAAGQIFGLPARNVYNVAYGLTKRVSPSTAYKIDTAFYNKKYTSDLNKAIARGDDDMIATIVELMTDERVSDIGDSAVSKELNSLVTKGFDVIPRSVGEKITYNGEEINLTSGQRKQFKQVYSVANKAVASLVKLSQYESASDEVKAKAIKYIYNVYYNLALQDLLGEDLETKTVLFAEAIDVEKLAIIVATANSLTADLDKKGNAISGTRKRKIQAYVNSLKLSAAQKYMVMGYLGFSNLKGEMQVKAYINRLNLTKSEKEKLLKYSGYEK